MSQRKDGRNETAAADVASADLAVQMPGLALQRNIGNQAMQRLIGGRGAMPAGLRSPSNAIAPVHSFAALSAPAQAQRSGHSSVAAQATGSINRSLIQLKRTMVMSDTTTRIRKGDLTGDAKKDLKAVSSGAKGKKYKKADDVDLNDAGHAMGPGGTVAWFRVGPPQNKEYIKAGTVMASFTGANTFDSKTPGGEEGGGAGWGAAKGVGDIANAADDPAVEWARKLEMDKSKWETANPDKDVDTDPSAPQGASTELTRAEGGLWLVGGIFGMATSMKDMVSNDKSAWERVEAAFNFISSGAATGGALAQIASTHMAEGDSQDLASETSGWLLGYQEMFTTLAAGVKTIKGVVDIVKMLADENHYSKAEWVRASGKLLQAGLETSKGVLRSIRQVSEVVGGGITDMFAQVLPGIDIAIAAVKSIMQGFYLVVSAVGWHQMATQKKELLGESGQSKERMEEARKAYRHDASRIAHLDSMIAEKVVKIAKAKKELAATRDPKKQRVLQEKIASLEKKKETYEANRRSASIDSDLTETAQTQQGGPSRLQIEEYDLASVLETANQHRVLRQAIHITANLIQIAASIASLVSGPGAPAAIALKASAMGIDMSLPFFRWVKQQGRNVAAKNQAKGKDGLANKIFNADKSDAAKLADRKKQAVVILKMVASLNPLIDRASQGDPAARPALMAHKKRIELYLSASGVEKRELYARNGKPAEQVLLLVKAMAQRELDE